MKDPTDAIITAFYTTLNGQLSYNSKNWPFKTFGEASEDYDNVMLTDVTVGDDGSQTQNITDCSVILDVRQGSKNLGSWKATNSVSDQIVQLLVKKPISFTGYGLTRDIFFSSNLVTEYTGEYIIMRKILRFTFKLQES